MKAVGIILAGGRSEKLGDLTKGRATAALPIGGCYRAIDFSVSNMAHSGVTKVAVITQYNSRSLHDHLSSPKWWDLGSKQGGLFLLSPYLSSANSAWFRGTADSIYQNLTFLRRSNEPYVVISSGDTIYKMDYREMIKYHEERNADVTIAYRKVPGSDDIKQYGVLELDANGRVMDLEEKPLEAESDMASIGVYIIRRELLIDLVQTIVSEGRYDLVRDLFRHYRKRLNIQGYKFDGYWRNLRSIDTYFECNMDFLKLGVREEFVAQPPFIKTKPKDEPPAKYNGDASVKNCLVGSGSILEGTVKSSVLFRRVHVKGDASVEHSVVMEGVKIGKGCKVAYAIIDKDVILEDGAEIMGKPNELAVVAKGAIIKAK